MSSPATMPSANGAQEASYTVSVAADLAGMHAQTLRQYDRLGIVTPSRAKGRGRRYSRHDIDRLRHVQKLTKEAGINLAGVQRILLLEEELRALRAQLADLGERLSRERRPSRGVFTADSSGRVQFRPQSPATLPGTSSHTSPNAVMTDSQSQPSSRGAAVQLAVQGERSLAARGLAGWELLASLRLQQQARKHRSTTGRNLQK